MKLLVILLILLFAISLLSCDNKLVKTKTFCIKTYHIDGTERTITYNNIPEDTEFKISAFYGSYYLWSQYTDEIYGVTSFDIINCNKLKK